MRPQTDGCITLRSLMKDAPRCAAEDLRCTRSSFATAVVLAAGSHHSVVSAGGMQLKHRSSERVHGGGLLPAQTMHLSSPSGE